MDNDLERKIEEINIKLRLGKLDSLFLFIPTLLGIAFSLSQFYLRIVEQEAIVTVFTPILILTVGIPIYIGYYRGGISLDSIVERARGWIYLANSFLVYTYFLIATVFFGEAIQTPVAYHPESMIYLLLAPLGGLACGSISYLMSQRVGSRILSLMYGRPSKQDERAFEYTGSASFFIAFFAALLAAFSKTINRLQNLVPEGFSYVRFINLLYFPSSTDELKFLTYLRFSVVVLIFIFFLFLLSEKLARGSVSYTHLTLPTNREV